MKIVALILGIILLAPVAFIGGAMANKSFEFNKLMGESFQSTKNLSAEEAAAVEKMVKTAYAEQFKVPFPSTKRVTVGAILNIVGVLCSLVLIILAFAKKDKVLPLAVTMVGLFAIAALVYPTIPTGPHDGVAPRPGTAIALAFAAAQGLLLWYYATRSRRVAA